MGRASGDRQGCPKSGVRCAAFFYDREVLIRRPVTGCIYRFPTVCSNLVNGVGIASKRNFAHYLRAFYHYILPPWALGTLWVHSARWLGSDPGERGIA